MDGINGLPHSLPSHWIQQMIQAGEQSDAGVLRASSPPGLDVVLAASSYASPSYKALLWGLIITSSSCSVCLGLPIAPKQAFRCVSQPLSVSLTLLNSPQSPTAVSHLLLARTLIDAWSFLRFWQALMCSAHFP